MWHKVFAIDRRLSELAVVAYQVKITLHMYTNQF